MPAFLEKLSKFIDQLNSRVGNTVAWLCFLMVFVTFLIVVMRYAFSVGSIMIQELVIYMFAAVFMLGGAYTYLKGGHVRVDIFFKRKTKIQQAWINVYGNLFLLLPTMMIILYLSFPYVLFSWKFLEGSKEAAGLDLVYLLKTTIPIMTILMSLQAVSEIIKNLKFIRQ